MNVRLERSYHLNDDDDTEVEKENVAQGKICTFSCQISREAYITLDFQPVRIQIPIMQCFPLGHRGIFMLRVTSIFSIFLFPVLRKFTEIFRRAGKHF